MGFACGSSAGGVLLAWDLTRGQSGEALLSGLLFAGVWAFLATGIFMCAIVLLAWGAERPVPSMVALKASIAGGFYFPLLVAIGLVASALTERLRVPRWVMNATGAWTLLIGGVVLVMPAALAWCVFWKRTGETAVEQRDPADEAGAR